MRRNHDTPETAGSTLPSVREKASPPAGEAGGAVLPAVDVPQGGLGSAGKPETSASATPPETVAVASANIALAERIAAATRGGGLLELPANFGDPDGGWESVLSEDPFEVLYLDFRQVSAITQRMVECHRNLLRAFWQEKMRIFSQGSGRVAIARKYGGPSADENRVRSYPDRIEKAFHRLSTSGEMERAYLEIVHQREERAIAEIRTKLADFLIDGALHPRETAFLFEMADRLDLRRAVVADLIDAEVRRCGLKSQGIPIGKTLEEQLLSVAWTAATQPNLITPPASVPRADFFPFLSLAALVLAVVLLAWLAGRSQIPEVPPPPRSSPAKRDPNPALAPVSTGKAVSPVRPSASPAPPDAKAASSLSETDTKKEDLKKLRRQLEQDQQHKLERLEAENVAKIELERSRRWEEQLTLLADFQQQGNFDAALTLSEKLLAEEVLPEPFAVRTRELAASAAAGLEEKQMKEWMRRLAEVEVLFEKGIYTEAKTQADLLAAEPAVPPRIAEKARKLAVDAVEALRAGWSKVTSKSTTVRPKNGGPPGDEK